MSDNSITVDQEILKSPSCSDFIQISSRSCRVYDEENATNDNLVTKEQCTSDFLSKPRESIHQEVPWNQENDMREVASMTQFYHLINVSPKYLWNRESFTRYEPILTKHIYQWNEETATPDKAFLSKPVPTSSQIKENIISNEIFYTRLGKLIYFFLD